MEDSRNRKCSSLRKLQLAVMQKTNSGMWTMTMAAHKVVMASTEYIYTHACISATEYAEGAQREA